MASIVSIRSSASRPHLWQRWKRRPRWVGPTITVAIIIAIAIFGPMFAPYPPNEQNLDITVQGPTWAHLLGTDDLGRDVVSRLLVATRTSMIAAFEAVGIALGLGVVPGALAGYVGGKVDAGIVWVGDALMSFPNTLLAIGVIAVLGPGLAHAMAVIGILFAPRFMRVARSVALESRSFPYVEAARAMGASRWYVARRHLLVRIGPAIAAAAASTIGLSMLQEAVLSFLGLGAAPPSASWGSMLEEGFNYLTRSTLGVLVPGIAIVITVFTFNLLADALHDRSSEAVAERGLGKEGRAVLAHDLHVLDSAQAV